MPDAKFEWNKVKADLPKEAIAEARVALQRFSEGMDYSSCYFAAIYERNAVAANKHPRITAADRKKYSFYELAAGIIMGQAYNQRNLGAFLENLEQIFYYIHKDPHTPAQREEALNLFAGMVAAKASTSGKDSRILLGYIANTLPHCRISGMEMAADADRPETRRKRFKVITNPQGPGPI